MEVSPEYLRNAADLLERFQLKYASFLEKDKERRDRIRALKQEILALKEEGDGVYIDNFTEEIVKLKEAGIPISWLAQVSGLPVWKINGNKINPETKTR